MWYVVFCVCACGVCGVYMWCCVVVWVVWVLCVFCVFVLFFFSLNSLLYLSCSLFPSSLSFFSLLSLFSLLILFLFSLLFSPPTTVERTDQPTRRPTSRHLNVIWRTAGAQQSVLSLLLSPPSSLLTLSSSKTKEEGTLNYRNISGKYFVTVLNKFQKIADG